MFIITVQSQTDGPALLLAPFFDHVTNSNRKMNILGGQRVDPWG